MLKRLGIRKITDIPLNVKTVTWKWIVLKIQGIDHIELPYEPFIERMEQMNKPSAKRRESDGDKDKHQEGGGGLSTRSALCVSFYFTCGERRWLNVSQ